MGKKSKGRFGFNKQELKDRFLRGSELVGIKNPDNRHAFKRGDLIVGVFPDGFELTLKVSGVPIEKDGGRFIVVELEAASPKSH